MAGVTLPGSAPLITVGSNGHVAWGFTNLGPDVTDFYLEQVTGNTYLRDGASALTLVRFVLFSEEALAAFRAALHSGGAGR